MLSSPFPICADYPMMMVSAFMSAFIRPSACKITKAL
jgi:hypothetical protein